jgi:nanoRNase/pAp phosphatase (c-di-AMP/oligoRNAs hydrolase)
VHPKDMQDHKIPVTDRDITTNLPYVEGVHLAFDHHFSETVRNEKIHPNYIIDASAPSAARVVYDYFGGDAKFPHISPDLMVAVDKADAARFEINEVINPTGWTLLNFLMDARTGLGRFKDFGISNYQLMMQLIDFCKYHTIDEILQLPDVKERVDLYFAQETQFKAQIRRCAKTYDNLVVLDLRNEPQIHAGNRFMVYALFPECNISIHVMWGRDRQNTVFATGKSIFNRTSKTNIGELMLKYGGGGHENAGTCQIGDQPGSSLQELNAQDPESVLQKLNAQDPEVVLQELIAQINSDG